MISNNFTLPTYVINLPEREERRLHIIEQFRSKNEFDLRIIDAIKHKVGAFGIWKSLIKVISNAISMNEDIIVFCEDDHTFTENYNKEKLFELINYADLKQCDYLSGGVGWLDDCFPVNDNLIWINNFWSMQFTIIFSRFYQKILEENFIIGDTADDKFSKMSENKFVIYPFISMQKYFGYSDVTSYNSSSNDYVPNLFFKTENKIRAIKTVYDIYNNKDI